MYNGVGSIRANCLQWARLRLQPGGASSWVISHGPCCLCRVDPVCWIRQVVWGAACQQTDEPTRQHGKAVAVAIKSETQLITPSRKGFSCEFVLPVCLDMFLALRQAGAYLNIVLSCRAAATAAWQPSNVGVLWWNSQGSCDDSSTTEAIFFACLLRFRQFACFGRKAFCLRPFTPA